MSILMKALFNKCYELKKEHETVKLHCLWAERKIRNQESVIRNKNRRISELHAEIDSLKRQNRELKDEIAAKNRIINRLIIQGER